MTAWTAGRVLRRTITRNRRRLAIGTVLIGAHQACEALVPVLIGVTVDAAVGPSDGGALAWSVGALAILFLALISAYRLGARQLMHAIAEGAHRLRCELAAKILHPRGIRTELRSGDLLSVSTTDASNSADLLDYVPRIFGAVTATTVCAIALLVIDVPLGLTVLIGVPVVLVLLQVGAPVITRRVVDQQERAGLATALATDLVSGARPLRGIRAELAAARRYRAVSQDSLRATLRAARTQGLYVAASTVGGSLVAGGVAVVAGWFALNGRIGAGEFITVIGLAQFVMEPAALLAVVPRWVAEARGSAHRVALVLNAEPMLPAVSGAASVGEAPGLRIRGLRYGPLDGVDLDVAPGELVGLVAHRAADSDALVRVLSGRIPPGEYDGAVLIGHESLGALDPDHARHALLVEPHHTDLFTGTIADNVRAGRPDEPDLTAALAASAADQLAAEPGGLDRPVLERGASLSGGQRQRVALARALLAAPPILVLHDPTTAVDAVTEHAIAAGVRALRRDGATLVVTSSPALLAVTDRVVVFDGGRVVAEGAHADLGTSDAGYRAAVLR